MRAANVMVFDEHLNAGSTCYTDQSLNDRLGLFDQLALMAVVDDVPASATGFKVQIEHSADGRMWLPKSGGTPTNPNAAEIGGDQGEGLSANKQTSFFGADPGTTPSLAHVRLKVSLATSSAHVRVFVTGRNWGGR